MIYVLLILYFNFSILISLIKLIAACNGILFFTTVHNVIIDAINQR